MSAANASVAKAITLDQARVVIVSQELARSKEFINVMQSAPSTVDLRLNAQLVISKEKAEDFIKQNKPKLETRPHKYFQFMLDRAKETGVIPDAPWFGTFRSRKAMQISSLHPLPPMTRTPKRNMEKKTDSRLARFN